jgi:hypothetical protein
LGATAGSGTGRVSLLVRQKSWLAGAAGQFLRPARLIGSDSSFSAFAAISTGIRRCVATNSLGASELVAGYAYRGEGVTLGQ